MARKKKPLPLLESVTIEAVAAEGKCLFHWQELVVFVPFCVPGDVCDVQIRRKKHSFAEGEVVRFIEYSKVRAIPFCKHFGVCGGCKWQNLPYPEQLKFKQQQVFDQLTRIGKILKKERVAGVELIVACGDLRADYMDFLMTMVNVPMIYVRGNHDDELIEKPPLGAVCIEDRVYKFKDKTFMGLGGSPRYNWTGRNMYSETEMKVRALRMMPRAKFKGGVDVLVTHAPARGYGDLDDLPHRGFETFNKVMDMYHPDYMIHGHVHMNYGRIVREHDHPSGTKIINACGFQIIDI